MCIRDSPKELFESIVNLSKKVLGEETVVEEVILADEVIEEEVKDEVKKEEVVKEETPVLETPVLAPVEQPAAVSKSEFDSAIAEIKEMYTKVLESISPSQPQEVPESLSEVTEEVKEIEVKEEVEFSTEVVDETLLSEEVVDELVHDPESMIEKKEKFLYSQNRVKTTEDYVFNSLFNK
jgi:hypothetical protein